jgi:4-amino-4-deoxy-L-arabinose transferase-like glycosyltransferase
MGDSRATRITGQKESRRPAILIAGTLLVLAAAVYLSGLPVKVMEIDAAEYASISQENVQSGNILEIKHRGGDYLDKPPLLFWLSGLSFRLLGASGVTYKLPSLLFALLAFYSTYRLGSLLYNRQTGFLSAAILASSLAFILIANDVRTDTILAGALTFSMWQLARFVRSGKRSGFVLGFIGIGGAMLAKGPIGLMVPLLAFSSYLVWSRDRRILRKWYLPTGLLIIAAMLAPMTWGLFRQFGWRGVRFYFWTQAFGRLTGESPWRNDAGYFFFVHSFLWAFLPWSFLACYGIARAVRSLWRDRSYRKSAVEAMLIGGTVLPFIGFSLARYKLPHYIFSSFSLYAILTAAAVIHLLRGSRHDRLTATLTAGQHVIAGLMWLVAILVLTLVFPTHNVTVWAIAIGTAAASFFFMLPRHSLRRRLLLPSAYTILGAGLIMNVHFFPNLLKYQAGSTAAGIIQSHRPAPVFTYRTDSHSLDFYTHGIVPRVNDPATLDATLDGEEEAWVFTDEAGLADLEHMGRAPSRTYALDSVHISKAPFRFLNSRTRDRAVRKAYLMLYTAASP